MQEQNNAGAERGKREMIALLNGGDKRELRAFMQLYSRQIYDRALSITHDAAKAKDAARRVLAEVAALAARGGLKENIDAQLMALTDQICSEAIFLDGLVDDALKADAPAETECVEHCAAAAEQQEALMEHAEEAQPGGFRFIAEESPEENTSVEAAAFADDETEEYAAEQVCVEVPDLFDDDVDVPRKPRREKPAKRRARALSEEGEGASPLLVIAIILLSFFVVFLVWVLVVKLMTSGILPNYDFGFAQWFNTHVFELY